MKKKYIIAMLLCVGILAWDNASAASALAGEIEDIREAESLQTSIAEKILRFHILANSDSDTDQNVKQKVRDAVGQMMEPYLADSAGLAETEAIVQEHIEEIEDIAESVLAENGFGYGAKAELATAEFPIKTYGPFTFPAGSYRALEITLGEGGGHNWWCVLYPNMCFRGTVYEVDEESGEILREVLSSKEYEKIFRSKKYKVRFKLLEYLRKRGYD